MLENIIINRRTHIGLSKFSTLAIRLTDAYLDRQEQARALQRLMKMGDKGFKDMGLSPSDIEMSCVLFTRPKDHA